MKHSYIARRFQSSGAGLSLDTEALAKYKDIIDLSIGDTDFTTDESIINAAFRDARAGHTHYGDPKGDPELIDAVCRAWEEDFGQRLPRDHVLVSASSCLGMALVMLAILDPGDEVIVFSPYFPMYREQIELAGGVCVDVPTYASEDYAINEARLRAAITPRTKAIVFNNPTNPTGMGYDSRTLELLARVAQEHDLLIAADESVQPDRSSVRSVGSWARTDRSIDALLWCSESVRRPVKYGRSSSEATVSGRSSSSMAQSSSVIIVLPAVLPSSSRT